MYKDKTLNFPSNTYQRALQKDEEADSRDKIRLYNIDRGWLQLGFTYHFRHY